MTELARLDFLEMDDVDQLGQQVTELRIDSIQLEEGRHRSVYNQVIFPGVTMIYYFERLTRSDEYRIPPDTTCFHLFKPGIASPHWCGFEVPNEVLLINQSGRDHFAVLPAGHEGVSLVLSNELVSELDLLPLSISKNGCISDRLFVPLVERERSDYRRWLFAQFASRAKLSALASDPTEATSFHEQALDGLAVLLQRGLAIGDRGNSIRSIQRYQLLRRACAVVDERLTNALTTRQLAAEINVGVRVLQYAFRDVLGTSPYQYLMKRKLHAARRDLRASPRHATNVYRVAFEYGFNDLGRFSMRYRQMFGEMPSETLKAGTRTLAAGA